MFENIRIFGVVKNEINPALDRFVIGWYFKYKGKEYGNNETDRMPTKLTEKDQIKLIKTMINTMEKLVK